MTISLNAKAPDPSMSNCCALMDCSLHPDIRNKPVQFNKQFSRGWKQRSVSLQELRDHVSSGGAFIPAAMNSEKRTSDAFLHADLAVVDIDSGLTIEAFLEHSLAMHAAWVYTTCSHNPDQGKNRFRIIFRLQERVNDPDIYKQILNALTIELGGDTSCTDPCRLFYGNDAALHPLFEPDALLTQEVFAGLCSKHNTTVVAHVELPTEADEQAIGQAIYVLENILRPTEDGERDRFVKITAAACSGGEALLGPWQDWASRCHHTTGHRAKQGTERFFYSFRNTRTNITTLFYMASQDDPDWHSGLPDELRCWDYKPAKTHNAFGYDHEDFLRAAMEGPFSDDSDDIPSRAPQSGRTETSSIFDTELPWTTRKGITPAQAERPGTKQPQGSADLDDEDLLNDEDLDFNDHLGDDFDIDEDPDDERPLPQQGHHQGRQGLGRAPSEAMQINFLIDQFYPSLRLNLLTQRYEYIENEKTIEIEDITTVYIRIAVHPSLRRFPPKTAVTDAARFKGRLRAYHPVVEYLNECANTIEPWPCFDKLASEILGLPEEPTQNPQLSNGRALADVVMERFLVAAVARIFEPGCTMQWMPILVGEQAIGKSRFLEMLTPEAPNGSGQHPWTAFNQVPLKSLAEKPHQLHCGWIVVLDETERHFKRDQVEIFKNLVSISTDRSARKYENELDFPRCFVLVGATNTDTFLKDPTGNRRFLPIYVSGKSQTGSEGQRSVDLECLVRNREAIWSAAVHSYRQAKAEGRQSWHFMSHELAEIKQYMDGFFADNPYVSKLSQASPASISNKIGRRLGSHAGKDYIQLHNIFEYLEINIDRHSSATLPITDALKMLGYAPKRINLDDKRTRVWFFPEHQQPRSSEQSDPDEMPDEF